MPSLPGKATCSNARECRPGIESLSNNPKRCDAMGVQHINRVSTILLIILSFTALLTVATGYAQPPQPDDVREHIFQLSIVALAPVMLVFLATADWRQPLLSARALAFPAAASAAAFAALYVLEHYR